MACWPAQNYYFHVQLTGRGGFIKTVLRMGIAVDWVAKSNLLKWVGEW